MGNHETYPGPKSRAMLEEMTHYVLAEPKPFVLDLPHCEGMWLATVDGQRIFDWAGYFGSKLLGHNHPGLQEPEYLRRLATAANNKVANPDFLTPECLAYYRLLHASAPECMRNEQLEVYAVNSGAEAVENMMKYLLNLHNEKVRGQGGYSGVRRFIYFDRAFHGRTVFALNVTQLEHDPMVTKDFRGIVPGNIQAPFPSIDTSRSESWNTTRREQSLAVIEDCLRRYRGEIVAMVVEPIQGAGGQRMASPEFFRALSDLAHRYDVYLGFDEVQTAGGQTGSMFAIDQFDLPHPPQAVAVAKKFGNGAVYMLEPMADRGILDSTWGGCLSDMVRWCREMEIVREEQLIEQVPVKADVLIRGLESLADRYHDRIFNIRGMGLYQGFTLRDPAKKAELLRVALEEEQLLLLGAGVQTIRFRPVLDVTLEDIQRMLEKLDRTLAKLGPARRPADSLAR